MGQARNREPSFEVRRALAIAEGRIKTKKVRYSFDQSFMDLVGTVLLGASRTKKGKK